MTAPDLRNAPHRTMSEPRATTPPAAAATKVGLARSLGQFVGHIWQAVRHDPASARRVLRHEVEEEHRGQMVLRRTTIEEIELRPPDTSPQRDRSASPPAPGAKS